MATMGRTALPLSVWTVSYIGRTNKIVRPSKGAPRMELMLCHGWSKRRKSNVRMFLRPSAISCTTTAPALT